MKDGDWPYAMFMPQSGLIENDQRRHIGYQHLH